MNQQEIVGKYKSYVTNLDEPMVKKAIEFAVHYHGSQKRLSGEPYYRHPLQVAEIIAKMHLDSDSIVTAILHDTIEDTTLTFEDIEREFNPNIAKLVEGVTKLTQIQYKADTCKQAENFRKLLIATSNDIRVVLIKLADRLHNMRTIDFISKLEKQQRIALETMEIYAPLAERIGIQKVKTELQDICFRVLNPEARLSILNRFTRIESGNKNLVKRIISELKKIINADDNNIEIYGRRKTPYSTWMKMKQKNIGLDQLCDIIAFRIVVEEVEDCYRVLGLIHTKYKMVSSHFQDFISTPKSNGYKSLHTVIFGPLKQRIEVQIRTKEMHRIAELGVAAHWQYKQEHQNLSEGKEYTWIRELISILDEDNNSDVLQNTKLAMYYDQVFCFTPEGQLISLPKFATVVDFAYAVHLDVGNNCSGAKINGYIVPLRTQVKNGDQVEIISSKTLKVSPSWEKFVVTGRARSAIRKVITQKQQEQYIQLGSVILSKALKSEGIENKMEVWDRVCKVFGKTLDELFCSVGKGVLTREQVLKELKPKTIKLKPSFSLLNIFGRAKTRNVRPQEDKVPIQGLMSGMALHYAKCCYPLPGDQIVGVIHTGKGVTIHTSDCNMLNNLLYNPEKLIDLSWDSNASNVPFICRLNVLSMNQKYALSTISNEIANNDGNIVNFNMVGKQAEFATLTFDIEVISAMHIENIINSLCTKEVIHRVERAKL